MSELPLAIIIPVTAVLGLCIGSFLNVVIYRLPRRLRSQWYRDSLAFLDQLTPESETEPAIGLAWPASHCPACKTPLKPWHNIPLLSYLWLKGKCAFCHQPIRPRYPLVELLSMVLSIGIILKLGPTLAGASALVLIWALIALAFIDVDTQLLPDGLTLPLLWLGLIVNYFDTFVSLKSAVTGAIAGYMALWLLFWIFKFITHKDGMGYGDFKLLAMLGAWFGWQSILFLTFSSGVLGIILFIVLQYHPSHREQQYNHMPFGPALAAAGVLYLFCGPFLINEYLRWLS